MTHNALKPATFGDHRQDRNDPTMENQLWHARKLLQEKGRDALNNPHAMIGRICGCGSCFCCAALRVLKESKREAQ